LNLSKKDTNTNLETRAKIVPQCKQQGTKKAQSK